ncbi:MAG: hypothetical protein DMG21_19535 [Acidobacteria bacterium]|nr:MAG: hypothetical protein DMG21_19535 [Acidobacteriota bacterium]
MRLAMLFGVNPGDDLVFLHLQFGRLLRVLGLFQVGIVLGARGIGVGLLLGNLVFEVPKFRLLIQECLDFVLPVELDEQVALLDTRSGRGQFDDNQRTERLAGDPRSEYRMRCNGLSRSRQAKHPHEIAPLGDGGRGDGLGGGANAGFSRRGYKPDERDQRDNHACANPQELASRWGKYRSKFRGRLERSGLRLLGALDFGHG